MVGAEVVFHTSLPETAILKPCFGKNIYLGKILASLPFCYNLIIFNCLNSDFGDHEGDYMLQRWTKYYHVAIFGFAGLILEIWYTEILVLSNKALFIL